MNCDGPVGVPRNRRGNSSSGTASADAKVTPNQGMIWTKRIVFSVDRLALFEFSPIHMPNHATAVRLATTVSVVAQDMASVAKSFGPVKALPTDTDTVPVPVNVVVTRVAFVVTVFVVAAIGGVVAGTVAATRLQVCCWTRKVPSNCAARHSPRGAPNIRTNARHWPCTI